MNNKHPTVLGVDPGVTTGIAVAAHNGTNYVYTTATCSTPEQAWEYVTPTVDIVVIERFAAQLISKYGLDTVEVVGGVHALCWRFSIPLIRDTPQQRKPYLEYARAQVPKGVHHTIHEVDALSHVVRYLYQLGYIKTLEVSSV